MITPAEQTDFGFGWMTSGGHHGAVPLGSGEYARLLVSIGDEQWRGREPGSYVLRAFLPGLAVAPPPPLPLELTADVIQRQRVTARHRPTPAEERGQLEVRIAQSRALLTARSQLAGVADAAASAVTHEAARDAVQRVLGSDAMVADAVVNARLVDFTDEAMQRTEDTVARVEARLADLRAREAGR